MRIFYGLLCCLLSLTSHGFDGLGAGLMLGSTTGLTAKRWLTESQAIDVGLGRSLGSHPYVSVHGDYLWHQSDALFFGANNAPVDVYYGVGGKLNFADEIELGLRGPVGLAHFFQERKAEVFGEVVPVLELLPERLLSLNLLVGLRIYFN